MIVAVLVVLLVVAVVIGVERKMKEGVLLLFKAN